MTTGRFLAQLSSVVKTVARDAHTLVVPVSGGSDSALCFWLCVQAFPTKTIGLHAGENLRGADWFKKIGRMEFTKTPGEQEECEEMRWARFLSFSLKQNAWLVGSRNRTEDLLGTYSLASRLATYLPLVNVWKSEVMDLCRFIGVPEEILNSSLRADPDCGRPQELVEISYEKIEIFLKFFTKEVEYNEMHRLSWDETRYLNQLVTQNAFKKTLPVRGFRF